MQRVADSVVTNVKYPVDETVSSVKSPLSTLMPELKAVTETLQKELLDPIDNKTQDSARETSTQTIHTTEPSIYQADHVPPRRLAGRNPW